MSVSNDGVDFIQLDGLRYRCKCGFPCFSADQEEHHRDGACLAIRLMVGVLAARERHGRHDHTGLEVAGMRVQRRLTAADDAKALEDADPDSSPR